MPWFSRTTFSLPSQLQELATANLHRVICGDRDMLITPTDVPASHGSIQRPSIYFIPSNVAFSFLFTSFISRVLTSSDLILAQGLCLYLQLSLGQTNSLLQRPHLRCLCFITNKVFRYMGKGPRWRALWGWLPVTGVIPSVLSWPLELLAVSGMQAVSQETASLCKHHSNSGPTFQLNPSFAGLSADPLARTRNRHTVKI